MWWLALADTPDHAWSRWTTMLDDEERARAARFVFERDRHQFIAAHALLRILLQKLAGGPAGAWRFTVGPHGKPSLHPDHRLGRIAFNISHTRGAVACAMTLDHDIGVDIEDLERPGRLLEIAHTYFAPDELIILRSAPPADQRSVFLRLWTLKEAYIKAHGDGLSLPLDRFAFVLSPPAIAFAPGFPDDPAVWQFATLTPTASHILSVAVRHGGTNPVAVAPHRMTHCDIDRLMTATAVDNTLPAGQ
ncbi:MAG TPA: 4'-phosphopantetheinyl transferase superfamily protein, partial [Vicinamibacterales bacterium]|nr:4'-phosphopantetheinyl transferase superfamily protein [Vicinamibacterales bacterium]